LKTKRRIHLIFIFSVSIFFSCSKEKPLDLKNSFTAAINVEQQIDDFDKVKFKPFDDLNLGFFRGDLWIKLEIQNDENENKSYMFVSNDRFNRNYIFYKLDTADNSLNLLNQVKDNSISDHRTFNNPNPNLKIDLKPNENATYLIVSASDGRTKDATPRIISIENYFNFVYDNTVWSLVFYGLIVCLLLINIYQWIIYKQTIYFYYTLYITSTILVYLGIEGYLFCLRIDQLFIDHFIFIMVKLWALSLIIFTTKFLNINELSPIYYRFIKVVLGVVLGGTVLYQFTFFHSSIQYLHYFENVLTPLWLLLIIGMVLLSAKAKRKELIYYLIPLASFVILTVIGVINVHFQLLPGNSFTYVKIGALVELIGFTYFMTLIIKKKLHKTAYLEKELLEYRTKLKEKEKVLASNTSFTSIFKLIENSLSNESDWDEFKERFQSLDPNFINSLLSQHPTLTKSEIRLLTLIRIGYSQKEIASILNIAPNSVKKARNRVRKSLNLEEMVDLTSYLQRY